MCFHVSIDDLQHDKQLLIRQLWCGRRLGKCETARTNRPVQTAEAVRIISNKSECVRGFAACDDAGLQTHKQTQKWFTEPAKCRNSTSSCSSAGFSVLVLKVSESCAWNLLPVLYWVVNKSNFLDWKKQANSIHFSRLNCFRQSMFKCFLESCAAWRWEEPTTGQNILPRLNICCRWDRNEISKSSFAFFFFYLFISYPNLDSGFSQWEEE